MHLKLGSLPLGAGAEYPGCVEEAAQAVGVSTELQAGWRPRRISITDVERFVPELDATGQRASGGLILSIKTTLKVIRQTEFVVIQT